MTAIDVSPSQATRYSPGSSSAVVHTRTQFIASTLHHEDQKD
jgi:hypothetical protein